MCLGPWQSHRPPFPNQPPAKGENPGSLASILDSAVRISRRSLFWVQRTWMDGAYSGLELNS